MIRIRKAQDNDLEEIARYQVAMALETESMTLDLDTVLKGVHAALHRTNPATAGAQYYIAEDTHTNQAVGCTLTLPEWSDWRNGVVWWIHSVYVIPTYRGKGVFKAIYEHLKTEVETQSDLRGLRLFVDQSNKRAQAVYKKLGMNGDHYQLYEWMKT